MSLQDKIWARQYAQSERESRLDGYRRVATEVASVADEVLRESEAQAYLRLMEQGLFLPGGRILAGAGTKHGNLLNCFVQDGSPYHEKTNDYALNLARKLALVTKVGGGNGLNLDFLEPKRAYPFGHAMGELYICIDPDHPNAADVLSGTYLDQALGQRVTKGYRVAHALHGNVDTVDELGVAWTVYLSVGDSIEEIWEAAEELAGHMLNGERVLVDLSNLRAEGTPVAGSGGVSSGPASFAVEIFDNFAYWATLGGAEYAGPVATLRYLYAPTLRVVRQGGGRRGAGMATLSVTHPDILDFVTCKDLEREAAEGDISTFNISVLASNDFMQRATSGEDAEAGELLRQIAEHAHATGEPGLLYVDTINEHNPLVDVDGPIRATNPCGEVVLYPGEPCDLGAINLAAHVTRDPDGEAYLDLVKLRETTRVAVRFLDNVLTLEKAPLAEIRRSIDDKRRIGLGVMGLADMLIKLGVRYDEPHGREVVHRAISAIRNAALEESHLLAGLGVPDGVRRAGLRRRNIALLTVAPTGTTSMLAGVSSGVEPVFAASYVRRIGTDYVPIVHDLLKEILSDHQPSQAFAKDGEWDFEALAREIGRHHGSIRPLLWQLPEDPRLEAFVVAHDIAPRDHVSMQGTVQAAFDYLENGERSFAGNSISKTINLPNEAKVDDVLEVYVQGWNEGLKGITVYRDGSRDLQVLTAGEQQPAPKGAPETAEEAAAQLQAAVAENRHTLDALAPFDGPVEEAPRTLPGAYVHRPQAAPGHSYKWDISGTKTYVQVHRNHDGDVVEVWTPAPRGAKSCEKTTHEIIGRLASLALKYGVPPHDVAEVFEGHYDETGGIPQRHSYVGSKWDLVAAAIRQEAAAGRTLDTEPEPLELPPVLTLAPSRPDPMTCPDCGAQLVKEEGCRKCYSCSYSACG